MWIIINFIRTFSWRCNYGRSYSRLILAAVLIGCLVLNSAILYLWIINNATWIFSWSILRSYSRCIFCTGIVLKSKACISNCVICALCLLRYCFWIIIISSRILSRSILSRYCRLILSIILFWCLVLNSAIIYLWIINNATWIFSWSILWSYSRCISCTGIVLKSKACISNRVICALCLLRYCLWIIIISTRILIRSILSIYSRLILSIILFWCLVLNSAILYLWIINNATWIFSWSILRSYSRCISFTGGIGLKSYICLFNCAIK